MKTRTYEGIRHGDWVRCVLCGAQMLLPCGADKCPECSSEGTLTWVDENRQEMDAKHLDCLVPIRKLELQEYLSPDILKIEYTIVSPKNERCVCENRVPSRKDGLYLIYGNGHAEPFTRENFKKNVRYIGLKHKDVSFAISLTEHDRVQLLDDDSRKESGSETYYERECDALFDINGRGNTERLVVRNPKLRNLLKDGEYIPSLRQLNLMAHYKDSINDALKYIGAEPLASEWFWSSTESSQYNAWYVYFFIGDTGSYSKYGSGRVRAVIDF